jgi:hypothetical protein
MEITHQNKIRPGRNDVLMLLIVLVSFGALMALPPFGQNPSYHELADSRAVLGMPNFLDVASNLAFLIVGAGGVWSCLANPPATARAEWLVLFVGVALVSAGSAYYHWDPDNETLVWDRLPMTIGFMGLFVALLSENVSRRLSALLVPALLIGASSVIYWHFYDDLRFYYWVQMIPLLSVALILFLYRPRYSHRWLLGVALGLYLLAKATESLDSQIFFATNGIVSGHTVKHLLAAAGCYSILLMLQNRRPLVGE